MLHLPYPKASLCLRLGRALGIAFAALVWAGGVAAQTFPAKPIHIVLPYPAGGTADILIRTLGPQLELRWGQPIVVEYKPGGGTVIGTAAVAKAPADGYTLGIMANSLVINAKLHKNLPYDALNAFEPVALLVNSPQVLVVNAASPYRSLGAFLDAARARPGTLSYATVGPATTQHIAGEMLKRAALVDLTYVPFSGANLGVNSLVGGHVTAVLTNVADVSSQIDAGKLHPLAVTTRERIDGLKQVPTVAESGYPDYEAVVWLGAVAPAGTPRDVIAKLAEGFESALNDPMTSQRLRNLGLIPAYLTPAALKAHIAQKYEHYSHVVDDAKIKLD